MEVEKILKNRIFKFKDKRRLTFKTDHLIYPLSFFIPIIIMTGLYISRNIYPFGDNAYLVRDMYHQYAPFFSEFSNKLNSGKNLTYSWNIGMGINFTALYAYYLASPTNWLLGLLPTEFIIEIMNLFIILKLGLSSLSFTYYITKHFKQKDINSLVFSMFYALSSYIAAYAWNIMWLDCFVLLPMIVLGLERLVKGPQVNSRSCILYCISLSLAIFSNYYIGFMLCIFSVIYFIYLLITEDTIRSFEKYASRILHFALFSLLAGCLSAGLLLPEYFALKMSGSGDLNFPSTLKRYFSIFEMLSRALINVPVSTGLTHEPNIYSTVAMFLLLPLYYFNPYVKRKEKIGKSLLLFLFLFSFSLNIPDFIWHGFHFPNSLPSRQSFIFIFLILEMSYEAFRGMKLYSEKQIYGSFAGVITLFLLFDHFIAGDAYDFGIIYVSMIFVALYLFVFALYRNNLIKSTFRFIPVILFFLVAMTETIMNTDTTGFETVSRTNYTSDTKSIDKLLDQVKAEDTNFYRIEKYNRRTKNDAAWHQYKGVSVFSSTTSAPLNAYLKTLGFQSSMNAYSFSGHTPLTSALLSVKYMLGNEEMAKSNYSELYTHSDSSYLYKNKFTLPIGFMLDSNFETNWNTKSNNYFLVQNDFVSTLMDMAQIAEPANGTVQNELYEPLEFNLNGKSAIIDVIDDDDIYLYTTTNDLETLKVTVLSPEGETIRSQNIDDLRHKYIVHLGSAEPGSTIVVTTDDEEVDSIHLYVYSFRDEVFESAYEELNKQPFQVESYKSTYLKGYVTAQKDGILYTSISYEDGWRASVDGKDVEIQPFKEALVSIPMPAGEHTVELTYSPKGLIPGLVISGISFITLIAVLCIDRMKRDEQKYEEEAIDD